MVRVLLTWFWPQGGRGSGPGTIPPKQSDPCSSEKHLGWHRHSLMRVRTFFFCVVVWCGVLRCAVLCCAVIVILFLYFLVSTPARIDSLALLCFWLLRKHESLDSVHVIVDIGTDIISIARCHSNSSPSLSIDFSCKLLLRSVIPSVPRFCRT